MGELTKEKSEYSLNSNSINSKQKLCMSFFTWIKIKILRI